MVSEPERWRVLLAANFGRNKNDEAKQRKVAVEYVRLCGYKHGEIGGGHDQKAQNGLSEKLSLDEIAKQLGTSKTNLKRALSIERNLTESVKELLDTGVITNTLAADTISTLSESEQEELISTGGTYMQTPHQYNQHLAAGIITEQMLSDCLLSLEARAEEYRFNELIYNKQSYSNAAGEKKNEYLSYMEELLSIVNPTQIHYESGGFTKGYYLYYEIADQTFHIPADVARLEQFGRLPVIDVVYIPVKHTEVDDTLSPVFVKKVLELVRTGNFRLIRGAAAENYAKLAVLPLKNQN